MRPHAPWIPYRGGEQVENKFNRLSAPCLDIKGQERNCRWRDSWYACSLAQRPRFDSSELFAHLAGQAANASVVGTLRQPRMLHLLKALDDFLLPRDVSLVFDLDFNLRIDIGPMVRNVGPQESQLSQRNFRSPQNLRQGGLIAQRRGLERLKR